MDCKFVLIISFLITVIYGYEIVPVTPPWLQGEGPHWDADRQTLWYVDALGSTLHRYVPSSDIQTQIKPNDTLYTSIIIPIANETKKFISTIGKSLTILTWDGESPAAESIETLYVVDLEPGKENNRFNDGKVDPTGRLWVGSMGFIGSDGLWEPNRGSIYSFTKNSITKHWSNITLANGFAWSSDLKSMYYIDTVLNTVDVFDFDAAAGEISNRRVCFDVAANGILPQWQGVYGPDGMTIDTNDNLWVAIFGGATVINIDPRNGTLLRRIDFPTALQPTSVAFGGPQLDELYVTSAKFNMTAEEEARFPDSGKTFRVTGLGVTGLPGVPANF